MNNSPVQNFWQLVSGNADQLLSLVDEESELAHELLEEVQHQLSDIDPHLTVFCARDESGTGIELVFEHTTGQPAAMASSGGKPKPSYNDG